MVDRFNDMFKYQNEEKQKTKTKKMSYPYSKLLMMISELSQQIGLHSHYQLLNK